MMELLKYAWLLLPAGVANMIPPFMALLWPKWNQPMDANLKFRGKRLMGDHKTVRGLITGTVGGFLVFGLQKYGLHNYLKEFELFDYSVLPIFTGLLLAFGALLGDAVKSFFKRQMGVAVGKPWFPWDQIDWILGMSFGLKLVVNVNLFQVMVLIVLGLILHLLVKVIGFGIRVNQSMI